MVGEGKAGNLYAGEDLVVVGSIGQQGMRALGAVYGESLSRWFSRWYLNEIMDFRESPVSSYQKEFFRLGATGSRTVGEGGIFNALWEFSGEYGVGISFWLRRIPVRQEVIEVCERCGCSPYRLWCGNSMLLAAENGGRITAVCRELGIHAAVIGRIEEGIARKILRGEETGYLERPREDELVRLLGEEKVTELKENGILDDKGNLHAPGSGRATI